MWMFEAEGFYSIVAYNPNKDQFKDSAHKEIALASEDPEGGWLLIRARMIEDLEVMEKAVGHSIYIQTDRYADYSFRALMSRDQFKAWLALAVDGITYGAHFKEASRDRTAKTSQANANKKYSAMMSVWSTMAALQPYVPYSGQERGKGTHNSYSGYYGGEWGSSYKDTSRVTSVTTSSGTTKYDSDDDYRSDDFYDSLFSGGDSARTSYYDEWSNDDEPSWKNDLVHDADADEWYNYAGLPVDKDGNVLSAQQEASASVKTVAGTVSHKGWTAPKKVYTPAPKRDLSFAPSDRWYTLHDFATHLRDGGALDTISDDDVDSMDDEVWGAWATASSTYGKDSVLTPEQIAEICGANVLADLEEGDNNEQD